MRVSSWSGITLALGLALELGCTPEPEVVVVGTRELGPVETAEGVESRAGGHSLFAFDGSVWLFGETRLASPDADGSVDRDNGWSRTVDLGAKDGVDLFTTPTDAAGGPAELFSLTAEELAFDQQDPSGSAHVLLRPLTGVRDDKNDRILLFYAKYEVSAGGQRRPIGSSVAVWTDLGFGPVRPVLDASSDEPTLLFHAPEQPQWGQAALVVGDQLYAYGCSEDVYHPCRLARVGVDAVFERDAWEFWTGHAWSASSADAVALLEADTTLWVGYNPKVGRYLAFHADADGESGRIVVRAAEQPEGPWSAAIHVFTAEAAISEVLVHGEYRRGGGQWELLSYQRGATLELLEVELAPGG